LTSKILNQAQAVVEEVQAFPRRRRTALQSLRETLETIAGRVRQVVKQTRARIFAGLTRYPGKIVSLFEPHTEIIRKGEGQQADGVRQAGQSAGGRESDHHAL
jgi:hypothetical protein